MEHKTTAKTAGYVTGTVVLVLVLLLVAGITTGVVPLRETYAETGATPPPLESIVPVTDDGAGPAPTPKPTPSPEVEIVNPDGTLEEEKTAYTVTVTYGKGGTVLPYGMVKVVEDGSISITAVPDEGYVVDYMLIDGINMGAVSSFVLDDIHENHAVYVAFTRSFFAPATPTPSLSPAPSPTAAPQGPIVVPDETPVPDNGGIEIVDPEPAE